MNTEQALDIRHFPMTVDVIEALLPLCASRIEELRDQGDELNAQVDELDCGGVAYCEWMYDELAAEEARWNALVNMHEVLTHIWVQEGEQR